MAARVDAEGSAIRVMPVDRSSRSKYDSLCATPQDPSNRHALLATPQPAGEPAPASGHPHHPRDESERQPTPRLRNTTSRKLLKQTLHRQVVEAARYQRSFFANEGTRSELAQLQRHHRVEEPVLPEFKASEAPPKPKRHSYMMLNAQPLRDLLKDISLLLDERLQQDYSADVVMQICRLGLFQCQTFRATAMN